jgi:hypothetical protein
LSPPGRSIRRTLPRCGFGARRWTRLPRSRWTSVSTANARAAETLRNSMRLRSIRASGGAAAVAGVQRGIEDVDMGLRGPARLAAVGVAVSMVASIGLLRVALGLHFVSDVLAGYVLGAAWVSSKVAVFNLWRRESGRPWWTR